MSLTKVGLATGLLLLSSWSYAQNTGDVARGKAAAAICASCHQADGSGMSNPGADSWPRLAGMNASYMVKQLQDFKNGSRSNPSMMPFATMLNDQQMVDVAAYFSQLPVKPAPKVTATKEQLALGEKLNKRGDWDRYIPPCISCHGPNSQGMGADFPALAGQHASYIEQQLNAWRDGKRKNDPSNLMLAVAERLTDEDIKAVAAWLSQQAAK